MAIAYVGEPSSTPLATAVLKIVYADDSVRAMADVHGEVGERSVAVNIPTSCASFDAYV